jgi:polyhydroxyalkanoate synthesis regulator phasin
MTEERRQILEMLAAGKINPDEADRLIGALQGGSSTATATATAQSPKASPKYIRVMVDAKEGKNDKPVHINVRVPIMLLRAGVRLASLIPASAQEKVNEELRKQGMDFDIRQIKAENIDDLIDQLQDLTVDVDHEDDDVKIRIFCE